MTKINLINNNQEVPCSCRFLLEGKELSYEERWVLLVVCGVHNQLAAEHVEGHSFDGRLSEEEENLVVDISKTLIRPSSSLGIR